MDAVERVKHLKEANWGPPLGGSFAQLREDLGITGDDLVAAMELPESIVTHEAFCKNPVHPGPCAKPKGEAPPAKKTASPKKSGGAKTGGGGEKAAADRLNDGKTLDPADPDQAKLQSAITDWSSSEGGVGLMRQQMQEATTNPDAPTRGALMMRTIAASDASSPTLHRGMAGIDPSSVPQAGGTIKMGPSSFSRSASVAHEGHFSEPQRDGDHVMHMTVRPGARSMRIDQAVPAKYAHEEEHVSMGQFRVISSTPRQETISVGRGQTWTYTVHDVEVEQVGM